MRMPSFARASFLALAGALPQETWAVSVSAENSGQVLLYPYYSTRDAVGGTFNTYLSVVNTTTRAKALRVRFREARNGRETQSMNVYLAGNDTWTAALFPDAGGTRLVTADASCVDPPVGPGVSFSAAAWSGANDDGAGSGLDRTREGYIEVLEMATLTGAVASGVSASAGVPVNCGATRGSLDGQLRPPNGGLMGTMTLINVADGSDYSVNAVALADVARTPYFRQPEDPYPSLAAAEVTPSSLVVTDGGLYRSQWSRGIDAVSAVLMRSAVGGEYVLDAATASQTDVVVTFPTRPALVGAAGADAPFTVAGGAGKCPVGELIAGWVYNREQAGVPINETMVIQLPGGQHFCTATDVLTISRSGSATPALSGSTGSPNVVIGTDSSFQNGQLELNLRSASGNALTSLPTSVRIDAATGAVITGAHQFLGLPAIGFTMRSLKNGNLNCGGAVCQGNYGSAFPLRARRAVTAN